MDVSVINNSSEPWLLPLSPGELARALEVMSVNLPGQGSGPVPVVFELMLLDDSGMAELNADFLGLTGPTNVLAFPGGATGSLALAVQTICRESWLYGQNTRRYTLKMLAHGLAHLMGYEHGSEMDKQVELAADFAEAVL